MTTHAQAHPKQLEATVTVRQKKRQTDRSRNRRTRGTFHRRPKPLYTEKHRVSCSGFLPKTKPMQHSCSHHNAFCSMTWQTHMYLRTWQQSMTAFMQPLQCDLQPQIQETHKTTHTGATTRCRTQRNQFRGKPACLDTHMATKRDNNHVAIPLRSATTDSRTPYITTHAQAHPKQSHCYSAAKKKAARWRYLSSPPAATLHGKTQGFMLRLPPQNKAHVTFLQSSQCVLQHDVANPHVSTHMATKRGNNHVAIPLRSATADSKTPYDYARTSTPKAA